MTDAGYFPLFCHRCGCELKAGLGNFYVVRLEAFADPTPARITEDDIGQNVDFDKEIELLTEQMKGMSTQELADQVYRKLTIHLCWKCYKTWIEDPAGAKHHRA